MTDGSNWLTGHIAGPPLALVTGGSFGLGLAMARDLVSRGFEVFICARTQSDLDAAVAGEPRLSAIRADVSQAGDREMVMAEVERRAGRPLDVLINNAAIVRAHDYANLFTLSEDRAAPEIETNFAAPVDLARLFLRSRQGVTTPGAVVMISTPGALFPLDANPLYTATKAGLHMFTLSLRRHLKETPVKVLEVFPPALDTRLANELEVASQAANGQDTIDAVARETVDGLIAGEETILPHKQSRALVRMFPALDEATIEMVNQGVLRRPGWDRD